MMNVLTVSAAFMKESFIKRLDAGQKQFPADETKHLDDPQQIGEPETHVDELVERRDFVVSYVGDDGLKAQFPGFDEELLRTES